MTIRTTGKQRKQKQKPAQEKKGGWGWVRTKGRTPTRKSQCHMFLSARASFSDPPASISRKQKRAQTKTGQGRHHINVPKHLLRIPGSPSFNPPFFFSHLTHSFPPSFWPSSTPQARVQDHAHTQSHPHPKPRLNSDFGFSQGSQDWSQTAASSSSFFVPPASNRCMRV